MAPVLRLQVRLRVPVTVEYDAGVGRREVDAQPARARRQEENVDVGGFVEAVNVLLAVLKVHGAVQAGVLEILRHTSSLE